MVGNSAPDGKLIYNDVTSQPLSKEMRQKSKDSLQHNKAYYEKKDGKQQRGCLKQRDSGKDNQRASSKDRSKSCGCYKNIQCTIMTNKGTYRKFAAFVNAKKVKAEER